MQGPSLLPAAPRPLCNFASTLGYPVVGGEAGGGLVGWLESAEDYFEKIIPKLKFVFVHTFS